MKPTRPNRWTIVVGATAIAGITAGTLVAATDDDLRLNDRNPAIQLNEITTTTTATTTSEVEAPPETAGSPAAAIDDSVASPFDSADDQADPSPVSLDSPPSPVSLDSPPSPVSLDSPPSPVSLDSPPSPVSVDSPDSVDSD